MNLSSMEHPNQLLDFALGAILVITLIAAFLPLEALKAGK